MAITRGEFLKSLRKSLPGMVLGSGLAAAAQTVLDKMAAASGAMQGPPLTAKPEIAKNGIKDAKIDFIRSGPPDGNRIALTFDDGPTPGVTDRILDELRQRQVHATFFMMGERIASAPDLARRVLAEGHEVANHTYTHPNLTALPDAQVETEVQMTQDIIATTLNHQAKWFRPPYGALRRNQAPLLGLKGLGIVLWNIDPADWSQPGEDKIIGPILEQAKPGSIILCHDVHAQTANSVGPILDGLLKRDFAFATLSTLLG